MTNEYAYCNEPNIPTFYLTNDDINEIYTKYKKKNINTTSYLKKKYNIEENNIKELKKKKLLNIYKKLTLNYKEKKTFNFIYHFLINSISSTLEKINYPTEKLNFHKIKKVKLLLDNHIKNNKTDTKKLKQNIINAIKQTKNKKNTLFNKSILDNIILDTTIGNNIKNYNKLSNYIIMKYIKKTCDKNNLKFIKNYIEKFLKKTKQQNENLSF